MNSLGQLSLVTSIMSHRPIATVFCFVLFKLLFPFCSFSLWTKGLLSFQELRGLIGQERRSLLSLVSLHCFVNQSEDAIYPLLTSGVNRAPRIFESALVSSSSKGWNSELQDPTTLANPDCISPERANFATQLFVAYVNTKHVVTWIFLFI